MVKIAKDLPHIRFLTVRARCIRLFIKQAYQRGVPKQVVFRSKIFPIVGFLHTTGFNPDINIRLQLGPSWPSPSRFSPSAFSRSAIVFRAKTVESRKGCFSLPQVISGFRVHISLPINNNKQETRIGGCYRLSVFPQIIICICTGEFNITTYHTRSTIAFIKMHLPPFFSQHGNLQ